MGDISVEFLKLMNFASKQSGDRWSYANKVIKHIFEFCYKAPTCNDLQIARDFIMWASG